MAKPSFRPAVVQLQDGWPKGKSRDPLQSRLLVWFAGHITPFLEPWTYTTGEVALTSILHPIRVFLYRGGGGSLAVQ